MNKNFFIVVVIVAIMVAAVCTGIVLYGNADHEKKVEAVVASIPKEEEPIQEEEEPEKEDIKIFSGDDRPIAIMIDNNVNAQPQSSINKAYIVYEIIVEGNETRLMPVFKGVDDDTILGPVRSVRHYFLDYMNENDAICRTLRSKSTSGK